MSSKKSKKGTKVSLTDFISKTDDKGGEIGNEEKSKGWGDSEVDVEDSSSYQGPKSKKPEFGRKQQDYEKPDKPPSGGYKQREHVEGDAEDFRRYQEEKRGGRKSYADQFEPKKFEESAIPTQPPFVAYIGNLPYDVSKQDIADFFGEDLIEEIHLPFDREKGKIKGFGYVDFFNRDGLKHALSLNGEEFKGRRLKIDISDTSNRPPRQQRENRQYSTDRKPRYNNESHERRPLMEDKLKEVDTFADKDSDWRKKDGSYKPKEFNKPHGEKFNHRGHEHDDSSYGRRPPRHQRQEGESSPNIGGSEGEEPKVERKKLNLQPRDETLAQTFEVKKSTEIFGEGHAWVPNKDIIEKVEKLEEEHKKHLEELRKKAESEGSFQAVDRPRRGQGGSDRGSSNRGGKYPKKDFDSHDSGREGGSGYRQNRDFDHRGGNGDHSYHRGGDRSSKYPGGDKYQHNDREFKPSRRVDGGESLKDDNDNKMEQSSTRQQQSMKQQSSSGSKSTSSSNASATGGNFKDQNAFGVLNVDEQK